MSDRYLRVINSVDGNNVLAGAYDDLYAQDIPSNSLLRQFADDYPNDYLAIEYTDIPDGFIGYPDGTYSYSGALDTVSFNLIVNGAVIDEYTSGIGTSITGTLQQRSGFLAGIGRGMS